MNRAVAVAKRDFENARRSYLLAGVAGFFTVLVLLVTALPGLLADGPLSARTVVGLITVPAAILVPVTAVIASYLAIAGERESGQLKILLSLPPSRRDVVLGKLVGRGAVVAAAVGVAFAVGALVSVLVYGSLPVWPYVLTAALTTLLGLSYVGVSVGLSAATSTRTRAMAPAIGLVVLFGPLWQVVVGGIDALLDFGFSVELSRGTVRLLRILSPADAYGRLFNSVVLPDLLGSGGENLLGGRPIDAGGAPLYLQDWFVFLLMVAWVVVPVALGYWRFRGADLG